MNTNVSVTHHPASKMVRCVRAIVERFWYNWRDSLHAPYIYRDVWHVLRAKRRACLALKDGAMRLGQRGDKEEAYAARLRSNCTLK